MNLSESRTLIENIESIEKFIKSSLQAIEETLEEGSQTIDDKKKIWSELKGIRQSLQNYIGIIFEHNSDEDQEESEKSRREKGEERPSFIEKIKKKLFNGVIHSMTKNGFLELRKKQLEFYLETMDSELEEFLCRLIETIVIEDLIALIVGNRAKIMALHDSVANLTLLESRSSGKDTPGKENVVSDLQDRSLSVLSNGKKKFRNSIKKIITKHDMFTKIDVGHTFEEDSVFYKVNFETPALFCYPYKAPILKHSDQTDIFEAIFTDGIPIDFLCLEQTDDDSCKGIATRVRRKHKILKLDRKMEALCFLSTTQIGTSIINEDMIYDKSKVGTETSMMKSDLIDDLNGESNDTSQGIFDVEQEERMSFDEIDFVCVGACTKVMSRALGVRHHIIYSSDARDASKNCISILGKIKSVDFQLKAVSNSFEERKVLPDLTMGLVSIIQNVVKQIKSTENKMDDITFEKLISKYTRELRPSVSQTLQRSILK